MHLNLDTLTLAKGSHNAQEGACCIMEAVSCLSGDRWTDRPKSVSPVIGAFMRQFNDSVDDETRQSLKRFIPLVMNTNTGAADDIKRSWMAMDWLIREHVTAWLDIAGLKAEAADIRGHSEITDGETLAALIPDLTKGQQKAAAARAAARDAAWDAAGDAAWDAAWDAAGDAVWDAVWDAAGDAAGDAAWDAAGDAAWDAAWDAAGDAAWAAAWDAAGDAAWDAAGDALKPTVTALQVSALALVERMCAVGK